MGEMGNECNVSVGRPEGKRQLGRPRRKRENDNVMDLREVGWEVVDWIYLALDRDHWRADVNMVINFGFHKMLVIS
jgi:hypothetical protein